MFVGYNFHDFLLQDTETICTSSYLEANKRPPNSVYYRP